MKHDKNTPIPRATAKRLSLYYRIFKRFNSEKIERANSKQIADAIGIDSATVRRDFSYFGELGRRGFGYDVKKLMNFFADLLNDNAITNVAIVGIGIQTAILTVPSVKAQEVASLLVDAGVKGILSFSPVHLTVPKDVVVQYVDLTSELQTLLYFMRKNEE